MGWFEDNEFIFIAMEYAEFGDLRHYIKNFGPKAKEEATEISRQLLQGVAILHKKKICHRDLNPQV